MRNATFAAGTPEYTADWRVISLDPRRAAAFALRRIDCERGCVVVVRPDQYVVHILPLDAADELRAFFGKFLLPIGVPVPPTI